MADQGKGLAPTRENAILLLAAAECTGHRKDSVRLVDGLLVAPDEVVVAAADGDDDKGSKTKTSKRKTHRPQATEEKE